MIKWLRRNEYWLIIFLLLSACFFLLRIPNLILQPIFADEAIYIRWSQVMRAEPTLRFLPLSDGKTPLYMWVLMPFLKVIEDPLYAGRILSVFSGFTTFIGVILISWTFFGKRAAFFGGLLIVVTPMILFFDRMALVDSMLAAFSIWSLYLSLLVVKYQRIDLSFILGYFLGGALLTKPPGFFNFLVFPATFILFNWGDQKREYKLVKVFCLFIISATTGFLIYNLLRLGPGFSNLDSRNQDYVFSPTILFSRPLDPFIPHLNDLIDWLPKILTVPVIIFIFIGIFFVLFRFIKEGFLKANTETKVAVVILFWGIVPLLIEMALLKTFTARYILFSFPPLLIIAGLGMALLLQKVKFNKVVSIAAFILFVSSQAMYVNFLLLTNLELAPLPREERRGYLEDWTAGYGLKDIADYLNEQSKTQKVVVGTEGSFGTLPDGLQIYLDKNRNVIIIGGKDFVSEQIRNSAKDNLTFFVANKNRFPIATEGLELIKEYPKIKGPEIPHDSILLFRVHPINPSPTPVVNQKLTN